MSLFKMDRRDLDFVLFEQFNLGEFDKEFTKYADMGQEEYQAILDAAIQLAQEELAPKRAAADESGCKLIDGEVHVPSHYKDLYDKFQEGGWVAPNRSQEHGGMGLPLPLAMTLTEIFIAGDSSFMFYPGLTSAATHAIEAFAEKELADLVLPKMCGGDWTGTMCLTEPQCGTALGGIKTTAEPTANPKEYKITGNKIFISAGDHTLRENIIHLVLARVPGDPETTRGISLFLVPKYRFDATGAITGPNDVKTTAIEHKMGINGSATCSLAFGDEGECIGYMVGDRCKGLKAMFYMMNDARIACGIQGSAIANLAYLLALDYAKERKQGPDMTRKDAETAEWVTILKHPDVRRNLMFAKAYSEGIRSLLAHASFCADYSENHPDEEVREKNKDLLDLLTPICKAYSSDKAFKVTELAIQIHGGYGFIKEYGVEQLMRDVKIASIYEGTNGVQALDLLGRKMRMKQGGLFLRWIQESNEFLQNMMGNEKVAELAQVVDKAKNKLFEVGFSFQERGKKDPHLSLLGATPFLEMFGHVEVARLFVEQASLAHEKLDALASQSGQAADELVNTSDEARFYFNKVQTATFFINNILPEAFSLARQILNEDRSALDIKF
ncbi:MAG: acyl-CoA dehydrogenase [Deltaproteobacteria bacterium]|nr:MAG: acyl-CoA dehydrogenase [Deltaproteobacteria bacterium]